MFSANRLLRAVPAPFLFLLGSESLAVAQTPPVKADFVFLIDTSTSMRAEIGNVASGLSAFAAGLAQRNVDARFSVVTFGTEPILELHFTPDVMALEATLRSLNLTGGHETGLEAIRMALGASPLALADATGGNGRLAFRPDAIKNLVLATDEDSDLPFHPVNQQPSQDQSEPNGCPLDLAWQAEVDATAHAVIQSQAFVNLLVREFSLPPLFSFKTECQYGDFDADVADPDLRNFDPVATLAALVASGFGASLEAQVLRSGLVGRTFDVDRVNDPVFVANFFDAKIDEVACAPQLLTYGNGKPGKLGLPGLTFSDVPRRGTQIEAIIVSSTDIDTHGCLLIGLQDIRRNVYGFELLVQPTMGVPLSIPANDGIAPHDARVRWDVPPGIENCGLTYYVQAVMVDDAVGISATRGVIARIGG